LAIRDRKHGWDVIMHDNDQAIEPKQAKEPNANDERMRLYRNRKKVMEYTIRDPNMVTDGEHRPSSKWLRPTQY